MPSRIQVIEIMLRFLDDMKYGRLDVEAYEKFIKEYGWVYDEIGWDDDYDHACHFCMTCFLQRET